VRVVLANVHTANRQKVAFVTWVTSVKPDLLVVEEVNSEWLKALTPLKTMLPYSEVRPRRDNFGIALLSRYPLDTVRTEYIGEAGVPSLVATLRLNDRPITVLATHPLPPIGREYFDFRNDQLQALAERIQKIETPVLVAGDLNVTMWSPWYRDLIHSTGLKNGRKGFGIQPTWPTGLPAPLRIPVDHVLHSPDFAVTSFRTGPANGSDHLPLVVDLLLRPSP
jgi:endonuclease/exonuclease/phosphatase (EEP) superfamily protein YafD